MAFVLAIVACALCPPLLLAMLKQPYWGALLVVGSIPLIPLMEIGSTSMAMLIGLAASFCWITNTLALRRPIRLPQFFVALSAYTGVVVISALFNGPLTFDTAQMILSHGSLLILTIFLFNVVDSQERLLQTLGLVSFSLSILLAVGLIIFIFDPSLFSAWHGVNSHRLDFSVGRGKTSADLTAVIVVALLPVQAGLYRGSGRLGRALIIVQVPLWLISLLLVASRSAVVGAVVALGIYLVTAGAGGDERMAEKNGRAKSAALAIAAVAAIFVFPLLNPRYAKRFSQGSATRRVLWRLAVRIFGGNILLGVGPGGFAAASKVSMSPAMLAVLSSEAGRRLALNFNSPHNLVLSLLVETGVIGLLAFGWFIASTLWTGVAAVRYHAITDDDRLMRNILRQLVAGFAGYLAAVMFLGGQRDRTLYVLMSAIAIAATLHRRAAAATSITPANSSAVWLESGPARSVGLATK
jgi:O-antigen ligase